MKVEVRRELVDMLQKKLHEFDIDERDMMHGVYVVQANYAQKMPAIDVVYAMAALITLGAEQQKTNGGCANVNDVREPNASIVDLSQFAGDEQFVDQPQRQLQVRH